MGVNAGKIFPRRVPWFRCDPETKSTQGFSVGLVNRETIRLIFHSRQWNRNRTKVVHLRILKGLQKLSKGTSKSTSEIGERLVFSVKTVLDDVYKPCDYFDTMFMPSQTIGINELLGFLLKWPAEMSCLPLAVRRARGNDLLIALLRYGAKGTASPLANANLVQKISHEGLSFGEWTMLLSYTGIEVTNVFTAIQTKGSEGMSLPMKVLTFAFSDVPAAYDSVHSWRYAGGSTSQRSGDPRIRTRFREVPLHEPSFLKRW